MSARFENKTADTAHIIGAGLSGLLLANGLTQADKQSVSLYGDDASREAHVWGYWDAGEAFLDKARPLAHGQWRHWKIATPQAEAIMQGEATVYRAVSSAVYEGHLAAALDNDSRVYRTMRHISLSEAEDLDGEVFDTAHYHAPDNAMLQHFGGHEVMASRACFDPDTAILMDFRVPQSDGIHFIYLLPYDTHRALVESTVFSPTPLPHDWYDAQIAAYLAAHFDGVRFSTTQKEYGIIPMAALQHTGTGTGIGLAGGALRASSGYAFHQIHRQIATFMNDGRVRTATSRFESWMDKIFLRVLRRYPAIAPTLFLRMATHMKGDDFAAFMNGRADIATLLRVILAVPKWPFIRSLI